MANPTLSFTTFLLLLSIVTLLSCQANGLGAKVGGRSKITDVKSNEEVQELGKFCVEQYNIEQRKLDDNAESLVFSQVVEAEEQVVSGIKYYLKIDVSKQDGAPQIFDAVVVVKAWEKSKELLAFSPSPVLAVSPSPTN